MTLRRRFTALIAAGVALAVSLACAGAWLAARTELRGSVDDALVTTASRVRDSPALTNLQSLFASLQSIPTSPLPGTTLGVQLLTASGQRAQPSDSPPVPVTNADLAVARGRRSIALHDGTADETHVRVVTVALRNGFALQIARPLTEVDRALTRLGVVLALVAVGGVLLAATIGFLIARSGLAPVERLSATAEHVTRTQDLSATIPVHGRDEIARLAMSFNAMLAALETSRRQQRQLVEDAGHELRTPLTSLRNNIELLLRAEDHPDRLPIDERRALLGDVTAQLGELGALVGDLVDLAREGPRPEEVEPLDFGGLVERAVDRVRLRAGGVPVQLDAAAAPTNIRGVRAQLERAVVNVIDNAIKWSPPGVPVRVVVARSAGDVVLQVVDNGQGIPASDLPHVTDRFYRATSARAMPGSGLGLAIVQAAVEGHGGTLALASPPQGGTVVTLRLPAYDEAPQPTAGVPVVSSS